MTSHREAERLGRMLGEALRRIKALEEDAPVAQLNNSSIHDAPLRVYDADGAERERVGRLGTGVFGVSFLGPTGASEGSVYHVTTGEQIVMKAADDATSRSGFAFMGPTFAAMSWGPAGSTQYARVQADQFYASTWAPVPVIRADRRFPTEAGLHRVALLHMDTAGNDIGNSVLELRTKAGDEAWLVAPVRDSGLVFGIASLHVSDSAGNYAPIAASAFTVASSRAVKDRIRPLERDCLAGVRAAPVSLWQYPYERVRPPKPDLKIRRNVGLNATEPGELVDAEWTTPPPDPAGRDHIGPMAEELPPELVDAEGNVDLRDQLGWLWGAVRQIADRLDAIEARLPPTLA